VLIYHAIISILAYWLIELGLGVVFFFLPALIYINGLGPSCSMRSELVLGSWGQAAGQCGPRKKKKEEGRGYILEAICWHG